VWLSEGFATYFTYLFVEHAYGRDEMVAGLRTGRDGIREFYAKNPDYRVIHDNISDMAQILSGPGTYQKGAWTLHMLRGLIGDTAFWTGIRDYYRRFRDSNATTADFRRAMEQASGQDLAWFFDQWLTRGGFPKLVVRWSYAATAKQLRLDVEQLQPGPPFRLPIELAIDIEGDSRPRLERIDVRKPRETLTLALDRQPKAIALDPRSYVLMEAEVVSAARAR
jgi:aminopeptidase N